MTNSTGYQLRIITAREAKHIMRAASVAGGWVAASSPLPGDLYVASLPAAWREGRPLRKSDAAARDIAVAMVGGAL